MESTSSHETHSNHTAPRVHREVILATIVIAIGFFAATYWTIAQWFDREPLATPLIATWTLQSAAQSPAFVRVQDTSFWSQSPKGVLAARADVASQISAVHLRGFSSPAEVILAPHSVLRAEGATLALQSGFAIVQGPAVVLLTEGPRPVMYNQPLFIRAAEGKTDIAPSLEPRVGSVIDLQMTNKIDLSWPKSLASANANLEFARDPDFRNILFSHPASGSPSASVDFTDRAPGAWFVRLREGSRDLAFTALNVVESRTPDQLRRYGRRWMVWRDRGFAAYYRIEFSKSESFQTIAQSLLVRNRELDLTSVEPGSYFTRVVAIGTESGEKENVREFVSRPISIEVQDKTELLRGGSDTSDPDLKLQARGWKILLTKGEATRLRDGYVILRESELRGVRISDEVFSKELSRTETMRNLIFELSRDESFANPERVRPDSSGELLPPALPLGILYARLRRIESDGTLGSYGPTSRLTTLLPAPETQSIKLKSPLDSAELRWKMPNAVPGFELRLSHSNTSGDFDPATVQSIHTQNSAHTIPAPIETDFFWNVTAVNELGQNISVPSKILEVKIPKVSLEKKSTQISTRPAREPAAIGPRVPNLISPVDEAVIVGGATARRYGKLTWDFTGERAPSDVGEPKFEVQLATDGDFVHVVETARTSKREFTLKGDLPEGAIFWRVRKVKTTDWSRSRKFELVYE